MSSAAVRLRRPGAVSALLGAISELIDNATKYGAAAAGVEIHVQRSAGFAELAVLDRGPGVPATERERIFEPFHRVGDELVRERPGVGLGLALVRGVALAHSGSVTCEPREGGGSCFVLKFLLEARA